MAINKLNDYRKSIDLLDNALVTILAERMRIVEKVGRYKKQQNIEPLKPKRWNAVLNSKKTLGKNLKVSEELIVEIYEAIHKHALKLEHRQK
jgi:chorismate mutase